MNSASTSTASLLSTSQSQSPSSKTKNYQRAFGELASSFGFSGSIVSAPRVSSTSRRANETSRRQSSTTSSAAQPPQAAYRPSQSQKNFEAAFGSLASSYGFGGSAPSPKASKV